MGDLIILAEKEFKGKTRHSEGFLSTTGDLVTLTATASKDMYIGKAKISCFPLGIANATEDCIVELKVNGVIKETAHMTFSSGTGAAAYAGYGYEFAIKGLKVDATQIIKLEVVTIDANVDVEGTLHCWEENDGVDPFEDFR